MKTQDEINAEIETLKTMKPNVRPHGMAGDNRAAIDAQIRVLEFELSDDAIWDLWPDDEEDVYERDSAREALAWMNDEPDSEAPHIGWLPLVKKI